MDRKIVLIGTLGRDESMASANCWTEANVMDQVQPHAPERTGINVHLSNAANSPDAKVFSTLQASFALQGWQLDPFPDPRTDCGIAYLISHWGHSTRVLQTINDVREALLQIGGAQ